MSDPSQFKLTLPSRLDQVAVAQDRVAQCVTVHRYSDQVAFAIRLAIDEAVTNAIRHGNGGDEDKQVHIQGEFTDQRMRLTVCDEGGGFDPDHLPDPTAEENLALPHGRGVMLMRAYMTEVHFNESGNCVTLVKDRDCPKPHG